MRATLSLCAILTLCTGVRPSHAQGVSLTPTIGVYVPTAQLMRLTSGTGVNILEQQVSVSVGGKLDIWLSDRVGLQGTGSYAPSRLSVGFATPGATDANLFIGSGRLMLYLIPRSSPISFQVNGGVGWLKRSGQAYDGVGDTSDVTGTVGAGFGLRLGPLLSLRVSGESYLYTPDFVAASVTNATTQNDFNLSVGFGIPLLGLGASSGN